MNIHNEHILKKLHFPIIIEIDEDGFFIVSCPMFKGCHSYGETIDEALENIKEVIEMCLEEQELEPVNKFVGNSWNFIRTYNYGELR